MKCQLCATEYSNKNYSNDMDSTCCEDCNDGMRESIAQAEWEMEQDEVDCACQDCVQFGVNMHAFPTPAQPDPNHECELIKVDFKAKRVLSRKKVA